MHRPRLPISRIVDLPAEAVEHVAGALYQETEPDQTWDNAGSWNQEMYRSEARTLIASIHPLLLADVCERISERIASLDTPVANDPTECVMRIEGFKRLAARTARMYKPDYS